MKLHFLCGSLTALLLAPALVLAQGRTSATTNELRVKEAVITLLNEVKIPARDPGVLKSIDVEEGDEVEKDSVLAQLDDTESKIKVEGAAAEVEVARAKASTDAVVRVAEKMADAAKADWEATYKMWQKGTATDSQERKDKVSWERTKAEIAVRGVDFEVDKLTVNVKKAALDAAKNEATRRKIQLTEDWKGVVLERLKSPGEWVQPGDTIMRIARMDRLRVEGHVPADVITPRELRGRPAKISVWLDATRRLDIDGVIKFASPEIQPNNKFRVMVEIENPLDGDDWAVRPGQFADIIIPLDRAIPAAAVRKVGAR